MKITVEEIANITETEVIVKCKERCDNVNSIIATLRLFDNNITVKADGKGFLISAPDIFYFENVEDKVFCYTEKEVYETSYRLYELENIFGNSTFLRINKTIILNANKIKSFKAALNGRMEAKLFNGEMVEISRNYVPALKLMLGGNRK
ncbi:MAG: LytTR family transcriptional regulator [Clostridia bacterium]|nr:LytTR family transcriptional regulator [Clostridia bacterium]